jgi:hypothetical protein
MAQQDIIIGTANAKAGDTLLSAFTKTQSNFTELYSFNKATNIIDITQESDFPTQDSSTISIESGMGYFIKTPFTTAKKFIFEGGAISSVVTDIPFITYTGTGVMCEAVQSRIRIDNLVVSCPNARFLQVTGDGTKTLAFRANVTNVVVQDCTSVANMINGGVMVFSTCNFAGTFSSSAILLTGSGAGLQSLQRIVVAGLGVSAVCFDMGTTVNDEIEIDNLIPFGAATATVISGLTNSGNITAGNKMMVDNGNFSSFTTPLSGVAVNDVRFSFNGNSGLADSRNAADIYLIGGSETLITGAAGDWQEVGIPTAGGVSWTSDIADRFTIGTNGVVTYIGEEDLEVTLSGRATVDKVGGGSNILEVRFAINWNGTASDGGLEKSRAQTQNPTPTTVPIGALTLLTEGDNFRAIFSNTDGTSNIVASVASLEVTG